MTAPRKRVPVANRVTKKGRHYTPEQRAAVLAVLKANDGKVKPTARGTGVPAPTIRAWRDAPDAAAPAELRDTAVRDLASEVDQVRWLYLERARQQGAISTTSGYYAAKVFGDLTNVHQLLTGKPTQRIEASPWGQLLKEIRDGRASLRVIDGGKTAAS